MKGLTEKQLNILNFISSYIKEHTFSPSYREIQTQFELSSLSSVHKYIATLIEKGYLENQHYRSRSLSLAQNVLKEPVSSVITIPIIGHLGSGLKIETFPSFKKALSVSSDLIKNPDNTYILQIVGSSFTNDALLEGDLLFVEARKEAFVGEVILGNTKEHGRILKKYYPEGYYTRLMPLVSNQTEEGLITRSEDLHVEAVIIFIWRDIRAS